MNKKFPFCEFCWGMAIVTYTKPRKWKKEGSKKLAGEIYKIKFKNHKLTSSLMFFNCNNTLIDEKSICTYCYWKVVNPVGLLYGDAGVFRQTMQECPQLLHENQGLRQFCIHTEDPSTRGNSRYAPIHGEQ